MCVNSLFCLSPSKFAFLKNANKLIEMTVQWNEVLFLRKLEDGPRILLDPRGFL